MRIAFAALCTSLLFALLPKSQADVRRMITSSTACIASDSYTAYQVANLRAIATATNPAAIAWRERVHLPAAPDTAVMVVSDSTTCARGLAAYNKAILDTTVSSLYLIRVGTAYVGSNPKLRVGEFVQLVVFDSSFALQSVYLK